MDKKEIIKTLDEKVKSVDDRFYVEEKTNDLAYGTETCVLLIQKPYRYLASITDWKKAAVTYQLSRAELVYLDSDSMELEDAKLLSIIRLFLREAKLLLEEVDE